MSEEKKLTDEEIVKALEHCATENTCRGCVKHNGEPTIDYFKCIRDTRKKVVDLIHRLQSENKTLKAELCKECEEHSDYLVMKDAHQNAIERCEKLQADNERLYKNIGKFKDAVRKETEEKFAKMLKEEFDYDEILCSTVDRIVKEITEGEV